MLVPVHNPLFSWQLIHVNMQTISMPTHALPMLVPVDNPLFSWQLIRVNMQTISMPTHTLGAFQPSKFTAVVYIL
jgi:hypothetical protein